MYTIINNQYHRNSSLLKINNNNNNNDNNNSLYLGLITYDLAEDECFVNHCNIFEHCAFEENLTVLLHIHRIENRRETEYVMYLMKIIFVFLFL